MATPEAPSTEQVEEVASEQTQEVVTPPTEQPQDGTTATEETTEALAEPPIPTPSEEAKGWLLKVDGQEVRVESEDEIRELAQKGFHFNRRMQAISEIERANSQTQQYAQMLLGNPNLLKGMVAQQMGINPLVLLSEPQDPDPTLADINPQAYWQQKAQADLHRSQRQQAEQSFNFMVQNTATQMNTAAFEKARIKYDLNDQQMNDVRQFVQNKVVPGPSGIWADQDLEFAVNALYGRQRQEQDRITQTKKIQQVVRGAKGAQAKTASPKAKEVDPRVAEAQAFKAFVKELSGG